MRMNMPHQYRYASFISFLEANASFQTNSFFYFQEHMLHQFEEAASYIMCSCSLRLFDYLTHGYFNQCEVSSLN